MSELDELLDTIGELHAAGADAARWPAALTSVASVIGGVASTLELLDRRDFNYLIFSAAGVPPPEEVAYLADFARLSPRVSAALKQRPGELAWDYQILDDAGMDGDPFYAKFLAPMDMRYSTAVLLDVEENEFAALAVQRSPKQGHVGPAELKLMRQLGTHATLALDVTRRLQRRSLAEEQMEATLDWLADGAMLVETDGRIVHANIVAHELLRRSDGIALRRGQLEFANATAAKAYHQALASLADREGGLLRPAIADFAAALDGDRPPYTVSVRPAGRGSGALALVFIHDPLTMVDQSARLLQQAFGLTAAEAHVADALRRGVTAEAYAGREGVSRNTVYTHIRRIKDKTGRGRMVELIELLNSVRSAVRPR